MHLNTFGWVILAMLVLDALIELGATWLNLRGLHRPLPNEFADVFDADAYQKSQVYSATRARYDLIHTGLMLIITLAFWFSGGFALLDAWARGPAWGPLGTGMLYFGLLAFGQTLVSIPFSLYSTFVIEERFGFNRTTLNTFLVDLGKGLLLTMVLGGALLLAVQALFLYAGPHAWLYAWGAMFLFTVIVAFIAPAWIMPLFSKFTPLEDGPLKQAIARLAAQERFPFGGVFVMDGSRRSNKSNAYFSGFGAKKRIVLFDTLIANHTVDELVAVLAHEIGHYKRKHILIGMAVGTLQYGSMLFLVQWALGQPALFEAFGFTQPSIYAGLILVLLSLSLINTAWGIGMNALARRHEYQADRFAAEATKQPAVMVSALKRLSRHNLSNLQPHPWYVWLHHNHPTALERINALRAASAAS